MTSNDQQIEIFFYGSSEARNPGKTVKAKNSVFDLLMTSNDL